MSVLVSCVLESGKAGSVVRKVVFVNRKPSVGQFSIERVFETLFRAFPFDSLWYESPFTSKGVFRRVINSVHVIAHWNRLRTLLGT